jgi:uncharacterized membrane protein YkvA (DUF1232 family)
MLNELLDRVVGDIEAIDPAEAVTVYADQLGIMKPQLVEQLAGELGTERARWAAEQLAFTHLSLIKGIPDQVRLLVHAAEDPAMERQFVAAILGTLVYLAKDRDLIPDDLPGGFGLIDDCMLLHVTTCECLEYLPRGTSTRLEERLKAAFLNLAVPEQRLAQFREEVENVRRMIFRLGLLAPGKLEGLIEVLQADPLGAGSAALGAVDEGGEPPEGPDYFDAPTAIEVSEDGEVRLVFGEATLTMRAGEVVIEPK